MAQNPNEIGQERERLADPSTGTASSAPTSDEIRSHIEQTRAEMSQTIDAIQARLSPGRLMTDAKQSVKDATVGRAKRLAARAKDGLRNPGSEPWTTERIVCVAKNNAVPVAFVGVAAAAVFLRGVVRSRNRVHGGYDQPKHMLRRSSSDRRPNKTRLLAGICVGLGCWSAWRTSRLAREGSLRSDLAQPM